MLHEKVTVYCSSSFIYDPFPSRLSFERKKTYKDTTDQIKLHPILF